MRQHRIIEKADLNGQIKFFPQERKFCFWIPFFKTEMFPVEVAFDSFPAAKQFIQRQKNRPTPKIFYL
jgi:hypothetical protein